MKKNLINCISILLVCSMMFFSGCGKQEEPKQEDTLNTEEIKNICSLVTLDVEIDNVATGTKKKGKGVKHVWEKDRDYLITYKTKARVYYDLSKVKIVQNGDDVEITLPEPEVDCSVEEGTSNLIIEPDSKINHNKVSDKVIQKKIDEANDDLEANLRQNSSLMKSAEDQAKTLITNHINQLNEAKGTEYKVTFVDKTE